MCTVMVVMRMRMHTPALHMSAVPLWQGSGPQLISLVDSTLLSIKMTAWRLIPSGPGYRYFNGLMVMACGLLNY